MSTTDPLDLSELDLAEKIADANARFAKATPAQKRVIAAKDLLLSIELGHFVPSVGYGNERFNGGCEGCAMAGLLASVFDLGGSSCKIIPFEGNRRAGVAEKLAGVFNAAQLGLIETAYECTPRFAIETGNTPGDAHRAEAFDSGNARERLIAILGNIIENEGTFKP